MSDPSSPSFLTVGAIAAVCLALCGPGCASDPQLTVESTRQHRTFSQPFTAAYCARDSDGNTDLVLMDRATEQSLAGEHSDAPVRQVMHFRVLWQTTSQMQADHTSAINSTVHWYVLGSRPGSTGDVVEYAGTAFVSLAQDGGQVDVTIQNASLRPVACRGGLCDPLGPSTVHGTIRAQESRGKVRQALLSIRQAVVAAGNVPEQNPNRSQQPESPSSAAR